MMNILGASVPRSKFVQRCGEDVSEQLDFTPASYFLRRTVRPKFRRKTRRELPPVVAPAPVSPLPGGLPSAALLAHLLVGNYIDHLPIFRQQKQFLRARLHIPRDLIIHWVHRAISILVPVAAAIRQETISSAYLQSDETPVAYLEPGAGKALKGYLWLINDPHGSLFYHWGVGRSRAQLEECIGGDYAGKLQCDGYSVYPSYTKMNGETELIGCLAHIRRGFKEVLDAGPCRDAALILRLIGLLYQIESELRASQASPVLREARRASAGAPVVRRIGRFMESMLPRHRPASLMGKALSYALGQWANFSRYLQDGHFEIDNNLAENGIRPVKLGAKNWLFFGSRGAGHNAAAIYTIVENCRRFEVPVEAYLKELFEALPTTSDPEVMATLTPAKIADRRPSRRNTAA